jgi:hypothetical protein
VSASNLTLLRYRLLQGEDGASPAIVVCSSDLLGDAAAPISAELDKSVQYFADLEPDEFAKLWWRNGKEYDHFIKEDAACSSVPGARMAFELLRLRLADKLFDG